MKQHLSQLTLAAALVLATATNVSSQAPSAPARPQDVIEFPVEFEVKLARAALPAHLRDSATIYVYRNGTGYRMEFKGTNGFQALVGRDDPALRLGTWAFDQYADGFLIPISFDSAGAETHLKTYLDLGHMRATGVPAPEAKRRLQEGFASGKYRAPSRPGIAYMLAPIVRAYQSTERSDRVVTFSLPHYMFYAPGVSSHDIGAAANLTHPTMIMQRPDPHGLVIVVVGEKERAAARADNAAILDTLCGMHKPWCLTNPR